MKKNFFQLIKYALLLSLVAFMLAVFMPRSYDVPQMHKRNGTQYWELQKGSTIAYTLVPAKGPKKPFPIIYLQGGPGGFISDRNIEMLAPLSEDGFDIYLYDQIGSGLSDRLPNIKDYTADRHKIDLAEIVTTAINETNSWQNDKNSLKVESKRKIDSNLDSLMRSIKNVLKDTKNI
jgi:proline iminopeptidase